MKENYVISVIQQVGIGVENFTEALKYYIDVFNMDIRILEDDTVAELMRLTGINLKKDTPV